MPLGQGYTAEEQISGSAENGGIQIIVYPMKRDRHEEMLKQNARVLEAVGRERWGKPKKIVLFGSVAATVNEGKW